MIQTQENIKAMAKKGKENQHTITSTQEIHKTIIITSMYKSNKRIVAKWAMWISTAKNITEAAVYYTVSIMFARQISPHTIHAQAVEPQKNDYSTSPMLKRVLN